MLESKEEGDWYYTGRNWSYLWKKKQTSNIALDFKLYNFHSNKICLRLFLHKVRKRKSEIHIYWESRCELRKGCHIEKFKIHSLLLYLCYSFHFSPVRLCIWSYQTWLSMTESFPLCNTFRFLLYISHFLDLSSLVTSSECKWQHNVVFIDGCVMYSVRFEWL